MFLSIPSHLLIFLWFLGQLYARCGAWTHDREIRSGELYARNQPDSPPHSYLMPWLVLVFSQHMALGESWHSPCDITRNCTRWVHQEAGQPVLHPGRSPGMSFSSSGEECCIALQGGISWSSLRKNSERRLPVTKSQHVSPWANERWTADPLEREQRDATSLRCSGSPHQMQDRRTEPSARETPSTTPSPQDAPS